MAAVALYLLLLLLPILAVLFRRWCRTMMGASNRRLPPSPWALPVIGHMHHLARDLPYRAMRDLARRHGPLILLRLGGLPVVVASSPAAAREVMKTHDLELATRPVTRMIRMAIPEGAEGVVFAPYGDMWRMMRKICNVELLSAPRVQTFGPLRDDEAGRLLGAVAGAASSRTAVNLSKLVAQYAADFSARAIIGSRFKERDAFLANLARGIKLFAKIGLPDLYPRSWLAMAVSRIPGRMAEHHHDAEAFMNSIIEEHHLENDASVASSGADKEEEDMLDVLLRLQREGGLLQCPLSTHRIKTIMGDMFAGGTDTASTTLQWIMAELIKNPRLMHKAQEEVRRELAGHPKVTEDGIRNLHYMHLVIKEALRLHPPLPLLLPRESQSNNCQILGYDVPKGMMVLVNAWAINRDPQYWGDKADDFIPERFENSNIDFKGTNFEYTPFGAGRRMCPGMAFALVNIELVLARLLYHFDWQLPPGMSAGKLDMVEEMGVTVIFSLSPHSGCPCQQTTSSTKTNTSYRPDRSVTASTADIHFIQISSYFSNS